MAPTIYSLKILVVEDFKATRNLQILALNELGFSRIFEAENGEKALEKIREEPDIGLVISDWNMPKMNGYDLLLQIRSSEISGSIPFIMATAQGEKSKVSQAIKAGANSFITKPFSPGELMTVIENVLGTKAETVTSAASLKSRRAKDSGKVRIDVAHIQITDHLVLGVLKHMIDTKELRPQYFELNPVCMPSWNPVQSTLEKGEVDAAFILAPMAMDLFSYGVPVKLVLLAHKNGSICVRNRRADSETSLRDFFKSRVFYLPHTMSIHNMLSDMFLREIDLKLGPVGDEKADLFFEVVAPIRMPEFLLKNPDACGFVVAEPFGSKAIEAGISELMFFSGDLWENHPCCVVAMRDDFIDTHEDAAHEFVQMLVQAGRSIADNPDMAARVAIDFLDPDGNLGFSHTLFHGILTQPSGILTDDLFPVFEDLDKIQRYMKEKMGIGSIIDIEKFADLRFAEAARKAIPSRIRSSKIHGAENLIAGMIKRQISSKGGISYIEEKDPEDIFESIESDNSITYLISSKMLLTDRVIRETKGFLKRLGFEAFSEFNLILRELLINAVEHGNRNISAKTVTCSLKHMRDVLFEITVSDQGNGFDYKQLDMAMPDDVGKLRKRGYPFIYAFSEKIEFNEKGNQITVYHNTYKETTFSTHNDKDWFVIMPSGDITATVTTNFGILLKKKVLEGIRKFRFDLLKVQEIDSVGLSAFIVLHKMLSKNGPKPDLEVINVCREIVELFRMTNLEKIYMIEEVKV